MKRPTTSPTNSKLTGRSIGKLIVGVLWALALVLLTATALELFLVAKWNYIKPAWGGKRVLLRQPGDPDQPEFNRIANAYLPFAVQHINPYYLFFFPFDRNERTNLSNDVCTLGPEGFRGPGPEAAHGRRLAFLIGGSAAFGHYASSDATTITGFLNRLQDEYLFVNAGVPSWNSLQELDRLAFQILDYHPALVIAYDGGNDVSLAYDYWRKGLDYPAGTPESFDKLRARVEDIRGSRHNPSARPWPYRLFPYLSRAIKARISPGKPKPHPTKEDPSPLIRAAARRFVSNLEHMQAMTHASGARFIAIFQPINLLNDNAPAEQKARPITRYCRLFRDSAFSTPNSLVEQLDYSTFFERLNHPIPWLGTPGHRDLTNGVICIDGLHLTDTGNRMVAQSILDYLRSPAPRQPQAHTSIMHESG